jgi:probable O-glycosylation ligase (exosortase A-associated)
MLRLIFAFAIIAVGFFASFQGPFYVLLFYLWNAYFRPEFWVWNDMLFSLRLSLVIGTLLLVTSINALKDFRGTRQLALVAAFLGQTVISLAASDHASECWPYWIEFFKVIVVSGLMTILVVTPAQFRLTLWIIAWSLGFETAKQGWAGLVLNPGAVSINTHVMLGDNNGVALGMMMLVPVLMALARSAPGRLERYIHYFVMIGVIYRGISTYSRGGFVAATVVFLLTLWRSEYKIRTILSTALLSCLIFVVMPQRFWDRMDTIAASSEESGRDESARSRVHYWGLAVKIANDHPIAGVGPNAFRFVLPAYDQTDEGMRATHSSWFGVLADLGYPGLFLFAAIAAGAIITCQRIYSVARRAGTRDIAVYAVNLQTSVIVFCVGGAFLSAQYLEFLWHVIALTITLGLVQARIPERTTIPPPTLATVPAPSSMPVIPAKLRRP